MAPTTALVWFRRDLRLEDNPAWAAATASADRVVPLYVLDPVALRTAGALRRDLLFAHLGALQRSLHALGGSLLLHHGDPTGIVPKVVAEVGAVGLFANADVSGYAQRRDRAVTDALTGADAAIQVVVQWSWGSHVHAPGHVTSASTGAVHHVFTPFFKAWSVAERVPWPEPGDAIVARATGGGDLPEPSNDPVMEPGEVAAEERLAAWLDEVDHYKDSHDSPADDHGTSHLSADLRWGTLSPRHVVDAVGTTRVGHAAFVRQLCWRDWYGALVYENPALSHRAMRPGMNTVEWRDDADGLAAWKEGRTGYPIVDAGMRQLAQTGRMHNRLRLIAASFLVKDLLVDWRAGEAHFRELLIDFEVPQNVGNWQWVAGTGPDAAPYFRIFNPVSQARRFDPGGEYVRRWVPELDGLHGDDIHAPWEVPPLELAATGITLGEDYPAPLVDHAAARKRALEAYGRARGAEPG